MIKARGPFFAGFSNIDCCLLQDFEDWGLSMRFASHLETSAFDNAPATLKWKNPLRDKVLTDSIHVKS